MSEHVEGGPPVEKLLTVPEVAELLEVTPQLVYGLIRKGSIRSVRLGRLLKVQESAVQEFIDNGGSQ